MKENTVTKATKIIKPIAENLGYTLVEVNYKKEYGSMILWVCIDSPTGITLNDCETLSHALDEPLDEADITNGESYNLNISSYGLDRSLKTDYDFNKFLNKEIVIKFYSPWNNKKEIKATLIGFDNDSIKIMFDDIEYIIKKNNTANITAYIKF